MINLIIWSKDRAVQLRLLLESIKRYMPDFFVPHIIYTYSTPEFAKGYAKVSQEFSADYIFESNLERDTRKLIDKSLGGLVAFSTDDTVIFKSPPRVDLDQLIPSGCTTFSLRLGLNTTLQDYYRNLWQPPLINYREDGDIIEWQWIRHNPVYNYGYPFGLDMHVYHTDLISKLIKYESFRTTNQLESLLFRKKYEAPQLIRSFKESVAVNIPDNNISGITQSSGSDLGKMNKRFLAGGVIDLDHISSQTFNACHQPVEYKWI